MGKPIIERTFATWEDMVAAKILAETPIPDYPPISDDDSE